MSQQVNYEGLHAPFNPNDVEFRPGATTRDKTKAIGLAYVDKRIYEDRLDNIVGIENWSVEYRHLGENAIICRLTIAGVVREDVGEFSKDDVASFPTAVAQAFKRACSSFGLGRYLYSLPQVWAEYDGEKRAFTANGMAHLRKGSFHQQAEQPKYEKKPQQQTVENKITPEKLVARIEELLLKAEDVGAEVQMPANWKQLGVDDLTKLGKQLNVALQS